MLLRPSGVVIDGRLELGLEVVLEEGVIREVRPHTGIPEAYVLSPAFVNAHSHLEYRGLQGQIPTGGDYWIWIRALTSAKRAQALDQVREDCRTAARENRQTGVALVAEHSDRPFSGEALAEVGIGGAVYQEIITAFEGAGREGKLRLVEENAAKNKKQFPGPVFRAPHAYYTVDRDTLEAVGRGGQPFSIHVAETFLESEFTRFGRGPIADLYRSLETPFGVTGQSVVASLDELGMVRVGAQFVHCCALEAGEVELLAERCVTVAHCPRSNIALGCPEAPIRELLDAGVRVGIGMDSTASSGPIDFFAEMRAALTVGRRRGKPLSAEEVWRMATSGGAASLPGFDAGSWQIAPCSKVPLIRLEAPGATSVEELIDKCAPESVSWTFFEEPSV